MNKEKEKTKDPKVNLGNKFICKICEQTFSSHKFFKKHNQKHHTPQIKCKSCEKLLKRHAILNSMLEKTMTQLKCFNVKNVTKHSC